MWLRRASVRIFARSKAVTVRDPDSIGGVFRSVMLRQERCQITIRSRSKLAGSRSLTGHGSVNATSDLDRCYGAAVAGSGSWWKTSSWFVGS